MDNKQKNVEKKKPNVHPGGRPTDYSIELTNRICEAVATSTLGLQKICDLNPDFPTRETIYQWRYRYKEFSDNYANSKRTQAELMAEEIADISDDGVNDTYIDEGKIKTDYDVIARSRLRVDTRKWIACKLLPKIYGDIQKVDFLEDQNKELQNELRELRNQLDSKNKKDY